MQDDLAEIIQTLPPDDRKEFRVFINRHRTRRDRKDLDLFVLLEKNGHATSEELVRKLYDGKVNRAAYHQLRKRLMRQLMDFVVLKRMEDDHTDSASVMGLLSLAGHLFDRGSDRLAWKYLRKAEKVADGSEQFDLLNTVYNLQVTNAHSEYAEPLEAIIDKRNRNKELADEDERANMAYSIIKQQLKAFKLKGEEVEFDELVMRVLAQFNLTDAIANRPRLLYKTMTIVRSAIIAKKDFSDFEPFIIDHYQRVETTNGFGPNSHWYKLNLLYMIAHVLYRNRKFDRAVIYLTILHENLHAYNQRYLSRLYPRYTMLLAACETYLGNNQKAIDLLAGFLNDFGPELTVVQRLNAEVNLAVYHFQESEFRRANRLLRELQHSDKWYAKKMGREWVLKKNLIELIVQYELDNKDIVMNRIRSLERNFGEWFDRPIYKRVRDFLHFIKLLIDKPDFATSEEYERAMRLALVNVPREQEDLQAMTFYSWLKAKVLNQDYYTTLMQVVHD